MTMYDNVPMYLSFRSLKRQIMGWLVVQEPSWKIWKSIGKKYPIYYGKQNMFETTSGEFLQVAPCPSTNEVCSSFCPARLRSLWSCPLLPWLSTLPETLTRNATSFFEALTTYHALQCNFDSKFAMLLFHIVFFLCILTFCNMKSAVFSRIFC